MTEDEYGGPINNASVSQQRVDAAPFGEDGAEGGSLGGIGGYVCFEERCVGAEAGGCDGADELAGRSPDRVDILGL